MPQPAPTVRYHAMDALRAFALLLGVFFHAAESFCPGRTSWAIVDIRAHWFAEWFQHVSHSFRMELFFVMAGFFAQMMLSRQGAGGFLAQRAQRVLLPLVLGWLILVPPLMAMWIHGAQAMGHYADLAGHLGIETPAGAGVLQATWAYYRSGSALGAGFTLGHLWFLHHLALLYTLFLLVRGVSVRLGPVGEALEAAIDRGLRATLRWRLLLPLFALAVVPAVYAMGGGVITANTTLLPPAAGIYLYGLCFGLGWWLHRNADLLPGVGAGFPALLAIGLALAIATGGDWLPDLPTLAYSGLYALMMGCFVFGFIGLFQRIAGGGHPLWRYLADASYWIYLIHLPVVVALQILLWQLHWPASLKYGLIIGVAIPTLLLSYHYWVRATAVGVLLNGKRIARRLP
ncbi:acyltransferase family protein [Pseudomarimonas salicorniae]|uniref:Acyltransferase family protein n=1 Tax=Pseudomarimonas salicorniae TaxID=2933270 RepID=A0ABT0GJB8_9GAMM|nr:acyltransferase family protein [Lysobacter sp. CAU 1642]MCK7594641.1 acyltransferase family protein [Lysobacter sp. CAU 1642]